MQLLSGLQVMSDAAAMTGWRSNFACNGTNDPGITNGCTSEYNTIRGGLRAAFSP